MSWDPNNNSGFAGLTGQGGQYNQMIRDAARRHGVPPEILLAIAQMESSGNPQAVGPPTKYGRAQGMFQFIPPTAQDMGLSDPYDPQASADAAARLLKQNYTALGDWELAAAAHNAGAGNIKKWGQDTSRWAPETRNYLRKMKQLVGGQAPGSQARGGILDYLDAPAPAPSAGGDDPGFAALAGQQGSQDDLWRVALMAGGANMMAGGGSLGQQIGNGLISGINAYGGALNAQQAAGRQGLEDQLLMYKLMAQAQDFQAGRQQEAARRELGSTMSPEDQLRFNVDPAGYLKDYYAQAQAAQAAELKRGGPAEFTDVNNLGKRYTSESSHFEGLSQNFTNVLAGAKKQNAAGDTAMLYGFIKMLNPNISAREGDRIDIESARGLPENIIGLYNKVVSGEKLNPEQRQHIVELGEDLWGGERTAQTNRDAYFRDLAAYYNMPPEKVVQDLISHPERLLQEYRSALADGDWEALP